LKQFIFTGIATVLLAAGIGRSPAGDQPPGMLHLSAEYAKVRDQVLPSAAEGSYRTIAWRNSVLQGVVDAQKKDRPVMIVLMNGHPLGCT
jgi:hypothetical protein